MSTDGNTSTPLARDTSSREPSAVVYRRDSAESACELVVACLLVDVITSEPCAFGLVVVQAAICVPSSATAASAAAVRRLRSFLFMAIGLSMVKGGDAATR